MATKEKKKKAKRYKQRRPTQCVTKFFDFNILCVQFTLLFHMLGPLHAVEYCYIQYVV